MAKISLCVSCCFFSVKSPLFFQFNTVSNKIFEFFSFLHNNNELKRMGTNTPEFGFGQDEDEDDDDDVWANVDAR